MVSREDGKGKKIVDQSQQGDDIANVSEQTSETKLYSFPIVGIGASAGGLEALKIVLENLPPDTGVAVVIVQHLAPDQISMLTEILSRSTTMIVHKVTQGVEVKPNNVYVIPPDSSMTITGDALQLHPRNETFGEGLKGIDGFLTSLAKARRAQAIGVILSGTGSDGTEGLKAIKAEGGLTFVQDPETAQYPGMPQSAISAETAYFILSPERIAKELTRIAKHPQIIREEVLAEKPKPTKDEYTKAIFTAIKTAYNVDFTHYKESTINRRITRRMVINQIDNLKGYLAFLHSHPAELQALFDDMLIGVTSFFREPQSFKIMKEKIFPELIKNRQRDNSLRIWIPGCSTGEEVYSIAITLQEFLEENHLTNQSVQIFGTDINDRNVERSRQGIFANNIEASIPTGVLRKYFLKNNGNYQITKFIRDLCVFAKQDLTKDPPFSNLDMICCRNVLIYFDSNLQEKVIPILHYALKPNGFLVLGESESVGKFTELFGAMEKKGVVYIKKRASTQVTFGYEAFQNLTKQQPQREAEKKDTFVTLKDEVDKIIMSRYIPAMILVNHNMDIMLFRGYMAPYLLPESGQASLNINKMLREELKLEVQTGIYRAKKENHPITIDAVDFSYEGKINTVSVEITPIRAKTFDETFFLVLFKEGAHKGLVTAEPPTTHSKYLEKENVGKDQQLTELRDELDSTKQSLQTIIEEQEATNEELRAAMEEVQSSNEELQSTNEELETAKEELQSTNEELKTLNDELKNRNVDLARLNDDLSNLIKNIDIALIMVDNGLRIRRFTPPAQETLGLIPTDVGRPITNIRLTIPVKQIEKLITEVITKLTTIKMDIQDNDGNWFELRIRPYITEEKHIDGAVISFMDIDEIKKAQIYKK
jgi:two-component system, chemotaxis family, CheB/CheR fusion protein